MLLHNLNIAGLCVVFVAMANHFMVQADYKGFHGIYQPLPQYITYTWQRLIIFFTSRR